ncbi:MAG: hypothetical protein JW775_10340 [Candidatus Aminicenantes bacterium]|nr:hypothetical protein [Candidatus Aminicenantes bacterium]
MVIMLRFILLAFLAYVAFLFIRVILGLKRVSSRGRRPREVQGVMVKDEICGTYIPREDAFVEVRGGVEHYFCSEDCRRKFLAG